MILRVVRAGGRMIRPVARHSRSSLCSGSRKAVSSQIDRLIKMMVMATISHVVASPTGCVQSASQRRIASRRSTNPSED